MSAYYRQYKSENIYHYKGIVCGSAAIYTGAVNVLNEVYEKISLPMEAEQNKNKTKRGYHYSNLFYILSTLILLHFFKLCIFHIITTTLLLSTCICMRLSVTVRLGACSLGFIYLFAGGCPCFVHFFYCCINLC